MELTNYEDKLNLNHFMVFDLGEVLRFTFIWFTKWNEKPVLYKVAFVYAN